jgi:hypothetical protein
MSKVAIFAPFVAVPRPSFCAAAVTSADTAPKYMTWLGGVDARGCSLDNQSITSNHSGTNGSKRTIPGHLGGGLT